jgi:hypothetical protein
MGDPKTKKSHGFRNEDRSCPGQDVANVIYGALSFDINGDGTTLKSADDDPYSRDAFAGIRDIGECGWPRTEFTTGFDAVNPVDGVVPDRTSRPGATRADSGVYFAFRMPGRHRAHGLSQN